MAVCTGRFTLHMILAVRFRAVSMEFLRLVTIKTFHTLFKMYISNPTIPSCIFRVNSSAMTGGASFVFIFFLEAMICKETLIDAGNSRRLDMAVSAGCMA